MSETQDETQDYTSKFCHKRFFFEVCKRGTKMIKNFFDFQNLCRYVGNFKLRLRFEVLKKLVNKKIV